MDEDPGRVTLEMGYIAAKRCCRGQADASKERSRANTAVCNTIRVHYISTKPDYDRQADAASKARSRLSMMDVSILSIMDVSIDTSYRCIGEMYWRWRNVSARSDEACQADASTADALHGIDIPCWVCWVFIDGA